MQAQAHISLSIIIVGGGVGGLATATFLAQYGHRVTLLERGSRSYVSRSAGGLSLFNNSTSLFKRHGLWDRIVKVVEVGDVTIMRRSSGGVIGRRQKPLPHAMVHRADLLEVEHELAAEKGVDIHFDTVITSIVDSPDQPMLKLADGTEMRADLIVGADGINSLVRQHIFPEVKPQLTDSVVMLVDVPRSVMNADSTTQELWNQDPFNLYIGPGRSIVSWAMHDRQSYHLQVCDHEYGTGAAYSVDDPPDAPYVSRVTDTSGLLQRWSDFEPSVQHIFRSIESYTKWKNAELPVLDKYSSDSGRIVLLGDAAHAVKPFAGQGANMSIEDGAALATLLSLVTLKAEIADAVKIYDNLRVARLAGLRQIISMNVQTYSMKNGEEQAKRAAVLATEVKRDGAPQKQELAEHFKWLEMYDAELEARTAWDKIYQS